MDAEVRQAEHRRDVTSWTRALMRLPLNELKDLNAKIAQELDWARVRFDALQASMPRCPCGAVGEPWCEEHVDALEKLEMVEVAWKKHQISVNADLMYAQAHTDAGNPGAEEGYCHFPPCDAQTGMDEGGGSFVYCDYHSTLLRGVRWKPNKGKPRG